MATGKACGIIDCNASKRAIEEELRTIKRSAEIPSDLELTVTEGVSRLERDPNLVSVAEQAKEAGMRYVIEATYTGGTNEETAKEVVAGVNQAYQSPLYPKDGKIKAEVIYEKNGGVVFMN